MKNHHLDLIRVTEAGAIAAGGWVGRGDKEAADKAATELMRERLNQMDFVAEIAIGEGIKDDSFGLYKGERVGYKRNTTINGNNFNILVGEPHSRDPLLDAEYSIAVDPIEGTTPTAKGGYEAMSVIALANHGCLFKTDAFYMNKLCVGPKVATYCKNNATNFGINYEIESIIIWVGAALGKPTKYVTVCVLDRPRHVDLVARLRAMGCRIKFIQDCDVTACIATCLPDSGIDIYLGVGGSPEAVIAAAAVKCMGGLFQAQISDDDGLFFDDKVYNMEDLAAGDVIFSATGITDGQLLKGIRYAEKGAVTESISMRSTSGTIRRIMTEHGN